MAKVMPVSSLVRAFLILAIFTTSFDIFLVFNLGFTFRIAQIFLVIPIGYVLFQTLQSPAVKWPLGFAPLLIWTFFMAIFIPNTDFPIRSIAYFLWLLFNAIMIFVVVQLIDDYRKALTIVRWYLYSYLFVAAFGIFQFISPRLGLGTPLIVQWWVIGSLPRVNGFSYEPSYFASYLIMGWVLTLYLLKHGATVISRKRLWLIAAIITLALILSSSRIGILTMVIWLVQYPLVLIWRVVRGYLNKNLLAITASLTLAFWLLILTVNMLGAKEIQFLFAGIGIFGQAEHSITPRIDRLHDTLAIFFQSPVIGYSLGGVASAIGHYRGLEVTSLELAKRNDGMSIFAEVIAASGIVGIIPFGIYIFNIILSPLRLAWKSSDKNLKIIMAGLSYALVIELIILQFNQNILRLYLWMHIAILSAVYSVGMKNSRKMALTALPWMPAQDRPISPCLSQKTSADRIPESNLV
ncbi:MAG: O-antigen ligase family protein [Desulfobulbaceae bacterium]|nr:O-antigen ligase family protein [Desulfobulbaceae bacterium]